MITEKSFKEHAEMLSAMSINVFFIFNRSMAAIKIINVLIMLPANHLPISIINWIHVEFLFLTDTKVFFICSKNKYLFILQRLL